MENDAEKMKDASPKEQAQSRQQTGNERGNYTRDRQNWLGAPDVNEIAAQIRRPKKSAD